MDDILGLALSPVVSCSAPASRPLASSANSSIQKSSAERIQLPIILDYHSDEGREEMRKWYHKQPTTRFTRVEHRKDITGSFRHEFIVVYLDNSIVCRFDGRAHEDMRGHALKDEGTISEDSAHVITLEDTESRAQLDGSEVLFAAYLDREQDLEFILTVCRGIQSHPKARLYSLLCYNCYFFSWTLVIIIKHKDLQVAFCDIGTFEKGAGRHNATFFPSAEDYIYRGMEESLEDYRMSAPNMSIQSGALFWTWSPSTLREGILKALWRGGQVGAKRYAAAETHRSPAPTYSGQDLRRTWRYLKAQMASLRIYKKVASLKVIVQLEGKTLWSDFLLLLNHEDRQRFQNGLSLQEYVAKRMQDHFKQVEGYGFGKANKTGERARESITKIWESVCDCDTTKDNDISWFFLPEWSY